MYRCMYIQIIPLLYSPKNACTVQAYSTGTAVSTAFKCTGTGYTVQAVHGAVYTVDLRVALLRAEGALACPPGCTQRPDLADLATAAARAAGGGA